ncbi:hypothetical protein GN958_ATG20822 [Phytophthora infestans]|uniref:Uncharacterized protein n=1 Tax=Phytophthora infestans TaxID=4787 RepID=A0A8S9TSS8_PHYIN|nr:hypothetical protein GN958_ATG20822 [Phytophthora infestans]
MSSSSVMSPRLPSPKASPTTATSDGGIPATASTIGDVMYNGTMNLEEAESCLMAFGAKQLRTECYLRQLRIVKKGPDANDHKSGYVALLMQQKRAFSEMQRLGVEEGPAKRGVVGNKRRTRHCMLRLLNVMFSDLFAHRLHEIDARATRAELDTNMTQEKSTFWTDFHSAYLSSRPEFSKLVSPLAVFEKCNPEFTVPHEAAKLRNMWKDITGRYATAVANSQISGVHDNDFFSFCSGKIDVLYMREWMREKPGLLESVEGKLPKRARLHTMEGCSDSDDDEVGGSRQSKKQRTRSKKGKSKVKEINLSDILTTMQANNASAQALELDCRLAQLMSSLNSLMELRERILRAPEGIYTHDDLMEVNEDIEQVRAKKKALIRK